MKKKQDGKKMETDVRIPVIPTEGLIPDEPSITAIVPSNVPSSLDLSASSESAARTSDAPEAYSPVKEEFAFVMPLRAPEPDYDADDTDDSDDSGDLDDADAKRRVRISRTHTLYEPRQKKKSWIKPFHLLIPLAVVVLIIIGLSIISLGSLDERLASPLSVKGEDISNAEFSFIYHYVLLENGVDIIEKGTNESLAGPGENGFPTLREFFLDMAAREIQNTRILYDDAISHGYSVSDSHEAMAQTYVDWLAVKADELGVSLDHYIEGYFGEFVTKDLILDTLSKMYFADDYASGPKLDELRASDLQAEDAYAENPYQYDLVSYRVLRIVYEQTDDNFKATAHLRAQEIIDGIGHDPLKFESVAANFFSGDAKDAILQPDSTLIPYVRYANVDNVEWRTWLFDPARTPGDCTIFDDENGFPILFCFSERTRQLEPLRDVRFFYINREDTAAGQAGIPDSEIMPLAQAMFDSVLDETSMQMLETTYADQINDLMMKAVHRSDSYRGELSEELDLWIFDPVRVPGDKTILESDTQVIIVYYVASSPNPEWFDRVNSFIRMKNYEAFLLEKQVEYPFVFNPDGLKNIHDVAN